MSNTKLSQSVCYSNAIEEEIMKEFGSELGRTQGELEERRVRSRNDANIV